MKKQKITTPQKKQPESVFECARCSCKMFSIKSYAKDVSKISYSPGQMFKLGELRKRLKCVSCGAQFWDTEIILPKDELIRRIESRDKRYATYA